MSESMENFIMQLTPTSSSFLRLGFTFSSVHGSETRMLYGFTLKGQINFSIRLKQQVI
jgi:hypothetical protein